MVLEFVHQSVMRISCFNAYCWPSANLDGFCCKLVLFGIFGFQYSFVVLFDDDALLFAAFLFDYSVHDIILKINYVGFFDVT